jgi:hypothetical protein
VERKKHFGRAAKEIVEFVVKYSFSIDFAIAKEIEKRVDVLQAETTR